MFLLHLCMKKYECSQEGGCSYWWRMTPPDDPVCSSSSSSDTAGIFISFDIRAACNVENTLGRLHFLLKRQGFHMPVVFFIIPLTFVAHSTEFSEIVLCFALSESNQPQLGIGFDFFLLVVCCRSNSHAQSQGCCFKGNDLICTCVKTGKCCKMMHQQLIDQVGGV